MINANTVAKPIITYIPATIDIKTLRPIDSLERKRVAAYARVSTDDEEQLNSYEAQVDYYTKHIKSNPDWEFVEVYADEGITGTNTKKRGDFNRMIADALAGKIDLIITKSVSRFARNTVDSLSTVRQLKEKGIEIYFEKENIYTLDSKGELLITIMSSLAQEESRSISENVTWGQRKRMQDGKVSMPYKRFLGYEKGPDDVPQIIESEAAIVRRIYELFLDGKTYRNIADSLTSEKIPTPGGKSVWSVSTVKSILKNEKYAGNAILQKKYTVDFLTKKTKINEGEVPQYLVENSHPAIVPVSTYQLVQNEIINRETSGRRLSGSQVFCGRIFCGQCGGVYGSKIWHSNELYRKVIWRCNEKYSKKRYCNTPHISENNIRDALGQAWSEITAHKGHYIAKYEAESIKLEDAVTFETQRLELLAKQAEITSMIHECIAQNTESEKNQEEYEKQYAKLVKKYEHNKMQLDELVKEKLKNSAKKESLHRFIKILKKETDYPTTIDDKLWQKTIESITIHTLDNIVVCLNSGDEIRVSIS